MAETHKPQQPVPNVTPDDVLRIVRRDYPVEQVEQVLEWLEKYGGESFHMNPPRVRLAALKNANGNLARLEREIANACADYRDVIAPAEYPNYLRDVRHDAPRPSADQLQRIFDLDWGQYTNWLGREAKNVKTDHKTK